MNEISLRNVINTAVKAYELKINQKYLQENLIALEELKSKNGQSYMNLIQNAQNAQNAKITALEIIKLANKGLIFGKDFNIIPFKNKLTTIIDSTVYQKRMENENWQLKRGIIYKNEKFNWDTETQTPKLHEIDFLANTSNYNEIIGSYAFGINKNTGEKKGILLRKTDIDRLRNSSPSGNSDFSPWNKWPKEMVEAKLYRKLAQELGVDIKDIDIDEKEIKDNGDLEYINFSEINQNKPQINNQKIENKQNETVVEEYTEKVMTINNDNFIVDDLTEWESDI